jgi:hypothetical protein
MLSSSSLSLARAEIASGLEMAVGAPHCVGEDRDGCVTGHRVSERPRRHTGEIVDPIWEAELPVVMDERDEPAVAVAEPVARLVLMAMARFTNPSRDQVYGPTREWRCWASVATIAELAGASERQVQRVLRVFEREHYIERVDQGRRPARNIGDHLNQDRGARAAHPAFDRRVHLRAERVDLFLRGQAGGRQSGLLGRQEAPCELQHCRLADRERHRAAPVHRGRRGASPPN